MILDAIVPSFTDGGDESNLLFLVIGIIFILCIVGIIMFYKVRNKRRKNEKK